MTPPGDKMPATGIAESVLAEMEARANAATAGRWIARRAKGMSSFVQAPRIDAKHPYDIEVLGDDDTLYPTREADVEFIVNCRTDVPALIAEVRRLSRLSLYDPRTHVCVEREDMEAERDGLLRAREDGSIGRAELTFMALNQWLSTPESK